MRVFNCRNRLTCRTIELRKTDPNSIFRNTRIASFWEHRNQQANYLTTCSSPQQHPIKCHRKRGPERNARLRQRPILKQRLRFPDGHKQKAQIKYTSQRRRILICSTQPPYQWIQWKQYGVWGLLRDFISVHFCGFLKKWRCAEVPKKYFKEYFTLFLLYPI